MIPYESLEGRYLILRIKGRSHLAIVLGAGLQVDLARVGLIYTVSSRPCCRNLGFFRKQGLNRQFAFGVRLLLKVAHMATSHREHLTILLAVAHAVVVVLANFATGLLYEAFHTDNLHVSNSDYLYIARF